MKDIYNFLDTHFPAFHSVKRIKAGYHSQVHSFIHEDSKYIVRSSANPEDYNKDIIIKKLVGDNLFVPQVLLMEEYNGTYYCVQPKIEGITADKISLSAYKKLLPDMFKVLTQIHSVGIEDFHDYGNWDSNKKAPFETWSEYLDYVHKEEKWQRLSKTTSFNIRLVLELYTRLNILLPSLEENQRVLIHGDFGRDNLIVKNGEITGIIDWGESKIGDGLYDIAWLDFWNSELDIRSNYQSYIESEKVEMVNFEQRYEASLIEIAISSLEWIAENETEPEYSSLEKRVKEMFDNAQIIDNKSR